MRKFALLTGVVIARAYETGKPGWKLDTDGKPVLVNGNPVYIRADGSEMTIEENTISRLNAEAKTHRERAEAAETKLKAFSDIDPSKARDALDKLSKIDQKKLIEAGEVDKVKDEISKQYQAQLIEKDQKLSERQERLNKLMLDNAFNSSKFVNEKIAIPPELFRSHFGNHFKIEDDKLTAHDHHGNKVLSKKRMGEYADFDEALEIIVESYAHKDAILKPNNASGSGNSGGAGSRGGSRFMSRADFDKLTPIQKAENAAAVSKGELTIRDN